MNKRVNFEDTLFIINVRIRMVKDLLRLDTETNVFYRQTIMDLEFVSAILDIMADKFLSNLKFLDSETEADNLLDTEWRFSQLLDEFSGGDSPYCGEDFPETQVLIEKFRTKSARRKKQIEDAYVPVDQSTCEPVVTHAELNGLLGSA